MLRSRSFDLVNRKLEDDYQNDRKTTPKLKGSYGADLYALEQDRAIRTEPEETSRRRTIRLEREPPQSWGFTLQTYGIRNKKTGEIEVMSYVDYIDIHGSAWKAGMRTGDIILSVNGESVEHTTHVELVQKIQQCRLDMRLVVLFENCCRKVELHERYLKLKKMMSQKFKQLQDLEEEESKIRQGIHVSRIGGFARTSNGSSISSDWDIYSAVTSPTMLNGTPSNQFAFRENQSEELDTTSCDSSPLESSNNDNLMNRWEPNASSEEICSSSLDLRPVSGRESLNDSREFLHSGQSDISEISEASDAGLRKLYNITRCAQRISDAGRSEGILAFDEEDSVIKNEEGSMTNLVEDSGIELKEVKALVGQGKRKQFFFIESDSEDSILNNSETDSRILCDKTSDLHSDEAERNVVEYCEEKDLSTNENVFDCKDNDISIHYGDVDNSVNHSDTKGVDSEGDDAFINNGDGNNQGETARGKCGVTKIDNNSNSNTTLRDKSILKSGPNYSRPVSEESTTSSCTLGDYPSGYFRMVSDDSSTSSYCSTSDASNINRHSIGTDNEHCVSWHQNPNLDDPSQMKEGQVLQTSTPLSNHSRHGEYNVRGARPAPSRNYQFKNSEPVSGATPVLLSYKKDENKQRHHQEMGKEDAGNDSTSGTSSGSRLYKKYHGSGSSNNKDVNSVVGKNCSLNVIQEDYLSSSSSTNGKSDSDPSLSSVSDSSCGEDNVTIETTHHNNKNDDNNEENNDNIDDHISNSNSYPILCTKDSTSTSSSAMYDSIIDNNSGYSSTTHKSTTKYSSPEIPPPSTHSSITYSSGTTVITIKPQEGAAVGPRPGNNAVPTDFLATTADPGKGREQTMIATTTTATTNASHQPERFVKGVLVNNKTQSTYL